MTNKQLLFSLLGIFLMLQLTASHIYVVNSESRTLSHIDTSTNQVNNSFARLGLTANQMDLDLDHIWVVCSGDNAILELDRQTGAQLRYINVAASSNPYDVLKIGDYLYVSGLFTDKVYKISLAGGNVVASLDVGISPEGLATDGEYLFVANTGGYQNDYAFSSVSVIRLSDFSLENTIDVGTNPQYLKVHRGKLHVSCTGNWFDVMGKVQIIDIASLQLETTVELGGQPGCIWISADERALVGDGMGAGIYMYMADSFELIHGYSELLQPGAFAIDGNQEMICLLKQNWGSASTLYLRNYDLSPIAEHSLAQVSTDIKIYDDEPSVNDDLVAAAHFKVYPNPIFKKGLLRFESESKANIKVSLYDVKGCKIMESESLDGSASLDLATKNLSSGMYLYKIQQGTMVKTGKAILM